MNKLIAGIKNINVNGDIVTRFFNITDEGIVDVTEALYRGISEYNEVCRDVLLEGGYKQIIPFRFKDGYIRYSFGCGLTHYFQQDQFEELSEYVTEFDLNNATMSVLTPDDFKMLFKKKVDNPTIELDLLDYYK